MVVPMKGFVFWEQIVGEGVGLVGGVDVFAFLLDICASGEDRK